jgi:hypothetical protein
MHLALLRGHRDRRWPPVRCASAGAELSQERPAGGLRADPAYVVIPGNALQKFWRNRERIEKKRKIRQQNKKKKGKKKKDSKKNVSSDVRIDGFEKTDANL